MICKNKMSNLNILSNQHKVKLYIVSIVFNLALILLLIDNTYRLEKRDFLFIYSFLFLQCIFYWNLYYKNRNYVFFWLHICVLSAVIFGLLLESIVLQFLILSLLTLIQVLSVLENKFLTSKSLRTFIIFYYGVLSLRVGYRWGRIQ